MFLPLDELVHSLGQWSQSPRPTGHKEKAMMCVGVGVGGWDMGVAWRDFS